MSAEAEKHVQQAAEAFRAGDVKGGLAHLEQAGDLSECPWCQRRAASIIAAARSGNTSAKDLAEAADELAELMPLADRFFDRYSARSTLKRITEEYPTPLTHAPRKRARGRPAKLKLIPTRMTVTDLSLGSSSPVKRKIWKCPWGDYESWEQDVYFHIGEKHAADLEAGRIPEAPERKKPKVYETGGEMSFENIVAAAERELGPLGSVKYPDGRTMPRVGDKVYQEFGGFGGSMAIAEGVVIKGRDGMLRVKLAGSQGAFGASPQKGTRALTPGWTVSGEESPTQKQMGKVDARIAADKTSLMESARRANEIIMASHEKSRPSEPRAHLDQTEPEVGMRVENVVTGQEGTVDEVGVFGGKITPFVRYDDAPEGQGGGSEDPARLLLLGYASKEGERARKFGEGLVLGGGLDSVQHTPEEQALAGSTGKIKRSRAALDAVARRIKQGLDPDPSKGEVAPPEGRRQEFLRLEDYASGMFSGRRSPQDFEELLDDWNSGTRFLAATPGRTPRLKERWFLEKTRGWPVFRTFYDPEKKAWMYQTWFGKDTAEKIPEPRILTSYEGPELSDHDLAYKLSSVSETHEARNWGGAKIKKLSGPEAEKTLQKWRSQHVREQERENIYAQIPADPTTGRKPHASTLTGDRASAEKTALWYRTNGDWPVIARTSDTQWSIYYVKRPPENWAPTANVFPAFWELSQADAMREHNRRTDSGYFSDAEIAAAAGSPAPYVPPVPAEAGVPFESVDKPTFPILSAIRANRPSVRRFVKSLGDDDEPT